MQHFVELQETPGIGIIPVGDVKESWTKVGEVPTFRASDTDTDLPIVSTNLFGGFQCLKNRFIASK
jgi:hypothetical protein